MWLYTFNRAARLPPGTVLDAFLVLSFFHPESTGFFPAFFVFSRSTGEPAVTFVLLQMQSVCISTLCGTACSDLVLLFLNISASLNRPRWTSAQHSSCRIHVLHSPIVHVVHIHLRSYMVPGCFHFSTDPYLSRDQTGVSPFVYPLRESPPDTTWTSDSSPEPACVVPAEQCFISIGDLFLTQCTVQTSSKLECSLKLARATTLWTLFFWTPRCSPRTTQIATQDPCILPDMPEDAPENHAPGPGRDLPPRTPVFVSVTSTSVAPAGGKRMSRCS